VVPVLQATLFVRFRPNHWHAELVNRLVARPSSIIARATTTRVSRKYDKNPMGPDWLSMVLFVRADVLFPTELSVLP
jgi:hypothetical protein